MPSSLISLLFPLKKSIFAGALIFLIFCYLVVPYANAQSDQSSLVTAKNDASTSIIDASFQEGIKALKENLPLIASKHFRQALNKQKNKLTPQQNNIIQAFLAESLVRADNPQEALDILTLLPQTPTNNYWTSIALIKKGKLSQATHWLSKIDLATSPEWRECVLDAQAYLGMILEDKSLLKKSLKQLTTMPDSPSSLKARIWLADTCVDEESPDTALTLLAPILNPQTNEASKSLQKIVKFLYPYARLVQAHAEIKLGHWAQAKEIFETMINDAQAPPHIKDLARISQAKAEIKKDRVSQDTQSNEITPTTSEEPNSNDDISTGADQLLAFISNHPESPLIIDAFNTLLQEKTFLNNPQALEKLKLWEKSGNTLRQPMAAYALATVLYEKKDISGTLAITRKSLKETPDNPVTHALILHTLYWLLYLNQIDDAEQLLKDYPQIQSAQAIFSAGYAAYQKGNFNEAEKLFTQTISLGNDNLIPAALYNANLAALQTDNKNAQKSLLTQSSTTPDIKELLSFEQAHYAAQRLMPHAIYKLTSFITSYPDSPWLASARLDLAEILLISKSPDTNAASKQIAILSKLNLPENEQFRLACLRVLLEEVQQNWSQALIACRAILKTFPNESPATLAPIKLKLGELLYLNGDFNETLIILKDFAEQYPQSDLAPAALFLAGKAAQLCNTDASLKIALDLFRKQTLDQGQFAQPAQMEIASILLRSGQARAAISSLETLLTSPTLAQQTRLLALSIQADAWASLSGSQPDALTKARHLCTEILKTPNLSLIWQFKALSQRAQYAEKEGDLNSALSDYAEILQYIDKNNSPNRRDWYWFYEAGFSSLHLLEMKQKWDEALALAQKLAKTSGSRAKEAANIAKKIKLEHFIWTNLEDNHDDDIHQQDVQLPVLTPLTK
ncbi:MAG: tetratricopeptide repeat protein [Akkermansia sp.]